MPRQLPWKVKGAAQASSSSHHSRPKPAAASPASCAASASRSPVPPRRPAPKPKPESTPEPSRKARRSLGLGSARSPSSSPPPAAEPLKEEFMIEGIDHDDQYRMVEDEFLAVAGEFTRHLHAAEYQRLKNLARSQNAETIHNISRPVTGEMTDLVKRRHAALGTAAAQRRGIARTLGKRAARDDDSTGDDGDGPSSPPPRTSLQGLMHSPRRQAVPLTSLMGTRSFRDPMDASPSRRPRSRGNTEMREKRSSSELATREQKDGTPRAWFKQEQPGTDSDDDNLDRQPPWPWKHRKDTGVVTETTRTLEPQRSTTEVTKRAETVSSTTDKRFSGVSSVSGPSSARDCPTSEAVDVRDSDADDDQDFFSRLRARRAEQRRRRESKRRDSNIKSSESQAAAINEIPFI